MRDHSNYVIFLRLVTVNLKSEYTFDNALAFLIL